MPATVSPRPLAEGRQLPVRYRSEQFVGSVGSKRGEQKDLTGSRTSWSFPNLWSVNQTWTGWQTVLTSISSTHADRSGAFRYSIRDIFACRAIVSACPRCGIVVRQEPVNPTHLHHWRTTPHQPVGAADERRRLRRSDHARSARGPVVFLGRRGDEQASPPAAGPAPQDPASAPAQIRKAFDDGVRVVDAHSVDFAAGHLWARSTSARPKAAGLHLDSAACSQQSFAVIDAAAQHDRHEAEVGAHVGYSVALGEHLSAGPDRIRARLAEWATWPARPWPMWRAGASCGGSSPHTPRCSDAPFQLHARRCCGYRRTSPATEDLEAFAEALAKATELLFWLPRNPDGQPLRRDRFGPTRSCRNVLPNDGFWPCGVPNITPRA